MLVLLCEHKLICVYVCTNEIDVVPTHSIPTSGSINNIMVMVYESGSQLLVFRSPPIANLFPGLGAWPPAPRGYATYCQRDPIYIKNIITPMRYLCQVRFFRFIC